LQKIITLTSVSV